LTSTATSRTQRTSSSTARACRRRTATASRSRTATSRTRRGSSPGRSTSSNPTGGGSRSPRRGGGCTVGRFSEKQLILGVIGGTTVLVAGFGALIWLDYQAIYKNEITDQNPGAVDVTDAEEWGERRKIQEIRKEMEAAQAEADLV